MATILIVLKYIRNITSGQNKLCFEHYNRNYTLIQTFIRSIVTIVPISVGTCDLESLVASGHKKIWWPLAANMGFCDLKDVLAFGNNKLWRPLTAKVKGHHSGLPKKIISLHMMYLDDFEFNQLWSQILIE